MVKILFVFVAQRPRIRQRVKRVSQVSKMVIWVFAVDRDSCLSYYRLNCSFTVLTRPTRLGFLLKFNPVGRVSPDYPGGFMNRNRRFRLGKFIQWARPPNGH